MTKICFPLSRRKENEMFSNKQVAACFDPLTQPTVQLFPAHLCQQATNNTNQTEQTEAERNIKKKQPSTSATQK